MTTEQKQGTIQGREAFMQNIAKRLGRPAPLTKAPEHPFRGAPDFYKAVQLSTEEKIELFCRTWTGLTGKVLIVKEAEAEQAIAAYAREVTAELEASRVAIWEHERLSALGLEKRLREGGTDVVPWRDDAMETDAPAGEPGSRWSKRSALLRAAERCQLGIVWPDYAIANTSTLVLLARGGKGRSVSLLPAALLGIFRADQLVTRMGEAFAGIKEEYPEAGDLPSSINLITGPSRSADIENDLTIGIHGPGKVYAVIIVP
ncbi:lactate utilization protein C [Paenibacillus sp. MBLB4367]|uniref:LutC/YkgG family protein n=1 Tax=Paenibacillus sp. MBLB4367 TaxID=3384767 RepID=UPI0039083EA7